MRNRSGASKADLLSFDIWWDDVYLVKNTTVMDWVKYAILIFSFKCAFLQDSNFAEKGLFSL